MDTLTSISLTCSVNFPMPSSISSTLSLSAFKFSEHSRRDCSEAERASACFFSASSCCLRALPRALSSCEDVTYALGSRVSTVCCQMQVKEDGMIPRDPNNLTYRLTFMLLVSACKASIFPWSSESNPTGRNITWDLRPLECKPVTYLLQPPPWNLLQLPVSMLRAPSPFAPCYFGWRRAEERETKWLLLIVACIMQLMLFCLGHVIVRGAMCVCINVSSSILIPPHLVVHVSKSVIKGSNLRLQSLHFTQ